MKPTQAQIEAAAKAIYGMVDLASVSFAMRIAEAALAAAAAEAEDKGKCVAAHMGGKRCVGRCMDPKDCCETPLPAAITAAAEVEPNGLTNLKAILSDQPYANSTLTVAAIRLILENKGGLMPNEAVMWFREWRTNLVENESEQIKQEIRNKFLEPHTRNKSDKKAIEAATIERCAQVAEQLPKDENGIELFRAATPIEIAAAIRALKDKP